MDSGLWILSNRSALSSQRLSYHTKKVVFDEKIVYTIGAAAIYLLLSLPLSGVNPNKIADPFYWVRLPFASEAGTLLEFGVLPIVTSAFLWQILSGFKFIKVNFTNIYDRQYFQSLQKVFAVLIAIVYASLLAISGYFQPIDAFAKTRSNSRCYFLGQHLNRLSTWHCYRYHLFNGRAT